MNLPILIGARLHPEGYEETVRTPVLDPTCVFGGSKVLCPPPAYANCRVFARNDEIRICVPLTPQS
ncbi:MAG: hypothetical protein WBE58_13110 [Verrucomicrobiales bacterium]